MEEALKNCKNSKSVIFNIIYRNGSVIDDDTHSNYSYCMSTRAFLEMIFDMINNNTPIEVKFIYVALSNYEVDTKTKNVNTLLFMDKYAMYYPYKKPLNPFNLETILGTDLFNYLDDDYKRHVLRNSVNDVKKQIKHFIDTQKSFDNVSEFERILNAIE